MEGQGEEMSRFTRWAEELRELKRPKPRAGKPVYVKVGSWVREAGKVIGSMHKKICDGRRFFVPIPGENMIKTEASKWISRRAKAANTVR